MPAGTCSAAGDSVKGPKGMHGSYLCCMALLPYVMSNGSVQGRFRRDTADLGKQAPALLWLNVSMGRHDTQKQHNTILK